MDRLNGHNNGDGQPRSGLLSDRLPPQNFEAEQGVIGSILLDNDVLAEILVILRGSHFYRDANAIVYEMIVLMDSEGRPIDALTLRDELELHGELEKIGGIEYIAEVMNSVPHAANAKYYAEIVRAKAVARGVIEACNETLTEAYSYQHTASELAENMAGRAAELTTLGVTDSVTSLAGPMALFLDRLDQRKVGISGIMTGFSELDTMTDGLQPGLLYVIAGRPSTGKSALALNIADLASQRGCPTLFFSLEMRSLELCERLICSRSGIPAYRIREPANFSSQDASDFTQAYDDLKKTALFFDDTPTHNLGRLSGLSRKYHRGNGVRLIVVDYLQLLDLSDHPGASRQELVAQGSRRLKIMARVLDLPVIILSQLNRQSEVREGKRPVMADLRESGAIEQDADVVILVHRPDRYKPDDQPGVVELIVDKNRNGATGIVKVGNDLSRFRLLDNQIVQHVPRLPDDAVDGRAAAVGPDF